MKVQDSFSDKGKVSSWAQEGMKWAVTNGIISGKGSSTNPKLDPQGKTTRAEGAQMMKSLIEKVLK